MLDSKNMKFIETSFRDLYLIEPNKIEDNRGFLTRIFCKNDFASIHFNDEFVQENLTLTKKKGTFRGFHYQTKPYEEKKLIRCISGKVLDIAIDLREKSETFLECYCVELNSSRLNMILIPEGFAHGFQTLTDNCLMLYLHTNFYSAKYEQGINVKDPMIKFSLEMPIIEISERDKNHIFLTSNFNGI